VCACVPSESVCACVLFESVCACVPFESVCASVPSESVCCLLLRAAYLYDEHMRVRHIHSELQGARAGHAKGGWQIAGFLLLIPLAGEACF